MAREVTQEYKLANGETIVCRPVPSVLLQVGINDLEQKWRDQGRMVDKPRFQPSFPGAETMGRIPWVDHFVDEERGINSLDDPDNPRQTIINWAMWRQYQADRAALEQAQEELQIQLLFMHGIDYDPPPNDEWADKIAPNTISVDPLERKFQYLWFVLLSPMDVQELRAYLILLANGEMVTREQLARFRRTIRPSMERAVGAQLDNALAELERVAAGSGESEPGSGEGTEGVANQQSAF